jgi:ankyrin repeat protein
MLIFQNQSGMNTLLWASSKGQADVVATLLKHEQVDVNLQNKYGWTALMSASCKGHADIVVELLKHGKVEVNLQANSGNTATLVQRASMAILILFRALLRHNSCEALSIGSCHGPYGNGDECSDGTTAQSGNMLR